MFPVSALVLAAFPWKGRHMLMSSRSRRAFVITALQDANGWQRLAERAGFVVDQRLEAPLGVDGEVSAGEGTVVLVLRQTASPVPRRPGR